MHDGIVDTLRREYACQGVIGKAPAFVSIIKKLKKLADKQITILLYGETGTGKGRLAEFVHQYGQAFKGPFIQYNCGAGPESLFESQLFGHVKGAFTGAHQDRRGLVEEAANGVLFLDEINSLDRNAQVKLNHFLESGEFRRVGENKVRKTRVRIIAAANVVLSKEVREGRFREDLYYRIAEYEVRVPPLRERKEDIELLVQYFLKKNSHLHASQQPTMSWRVVRKLKQYDWPGNIRELENVVKRCLIDCDSKVIDRIPNLNDPHETPMTVNLRDPLPWKVAKKNVIRSFEKTYLRSLLIEYHGVVAECARHAGVQPADFWKLLRKYKLRAKDFRDLPRE